MEIKPYKRSKNRHEILIESHDECLALADGLSHANYEVTVGTLDRVGHVGNLVSKLSSLATKDVFPKRLAIASRQLKVMQSGLAGRFEVLDEPRNIFDPTYNEIGNDVATMISHYVNVNVVNTA